MKLKHFNADLILAFTSQSVNEGGNPLWLFDVAPANHEPGDRGRRAGIVDALVARR